METFDYEYRARWAYTSDTRVQLWTGWMSHAELQAFMDDGVTVVKVEQREVGPAQDVTTHILKAGGV